MWQSEVKYRALLDVRCPVIKSEYLLKNYFIKQYKYLKQKANLPDLTDDQLHDICDKLVNFRNLLFPSDFRLSYTDDEKIWHEIVFHTILIAAYYESIYVCDLQVPNEIVRLKV
jgi:hypothetical protein